MDKLRTDLFGGFPWELDDWRWEINAHRDAIAGLCKGLQRADGGGLIVSGLDVTLNGAGGVLSISPGWMVWGGEPFYFPGGTGNGAYGPTLHFLQRDIRYDAATSETFEDGTVNNAYEIRRLKLVANGIDLSMTADAELYASIGRLGRLRERLWPGPVESVSEFFTGMSAPSGLKVRLDPGGIVKLDGVVQYDGFATGASGTRGLFTLPERYRPAQPVYRSVPLFPFTDALRNVAIQPNGNVSLWIHDSGIDTGAKMYFGDVRFSRS